MNGALLALLLSAQSIVVPGAPTGTISGRVLNTDGTPAVRVRVAAQAVAETPAAAAEAPVLSSLVQTDAQGNYRLEGVLPGRFYITAGLVDLPTYFPGVTSINDARVVTVAAGTSITGIDFKMGRPAGLTVRGRVKLEDGATMPANARVLMTGGAAAGRNNIVIPPDGTFVFEGVPPGRYTIGVSPTNGTPPQQIVLSDKDLEIELAVKTTIVASGNVVVEGDGPRPRIMLRFSAGTNVISAGVSQTGTFNVQLPPGKYRLDVSGVPNGYRLKSVTAGSMDWIKDEIVVEVGTRLPEFVVALTVETPIWVKVKGHVSGGVSPGTNVTMIGANAGEILRAEVGRDGVFEIPKVLPGPYTVRVEGSGLSGFGQNANPVQVNLGSSDLDNLELTVPQTVNVRGRLIVEGSVPVRSARLAFMVSGNGLASPRISASVAAIGTFSLNLPDGEYSLTLDTQVGNLNGYQVKAMTFGSENALGKPIKVTTSDAGKELVVTLERSSTNTGVKVSGHITNSPGGQVQISVLGTGFNLGGPDSIFADGNGNFEIPNVPSGSFTLRAFAVAAAIDVATSINVQSGKDLTGLEIPFPPQHLTSGKVVLDPDNGTPFRPRFWLTLTGSRTDTVYSNIQADGSFTVRLPLGDWYVNVGGLPNDVTMKSFTYGDKSLLGGKLTVTADDTQQLRMIVESHQKLVKVGGRVILGPQTPRDPQMRLMGSATVETTMNADGTFEFAKVLPGTYSFCCTYGYTSITIPNRDVTDLTLREIPGHVVMETGTLDRLTYFQANDGRGTSGASVGSDGSFNLILPEGSFRLQMSALPAGTYIKSIRYGAKEVLNQTFDFNRDTPLAEFTVTIGLRP